MKEPPTEETLRELYWDRGWDQSEIGDEYDVSRGTVSNWMLDYGIETRTGGREASKLDRSVRVPEEVRETLRDYADERDLTYDEALREVLPADVEVNVLSRRSVFIEVSEEAHERLQGLAGRGYTYGDVVEHFLREADTDNT